MRCLTKLLVTVSVLVLFVSNAAAASSPMVRLTYTSGWDALPAIVGIERGLFAQEGLVVSGMPVSSLNAIATSLVGGSTDFATMPQRALIRMAALKLNIRAISLNGWNPKMQLIVSLKDKNVKSLKDLKGKAVALSIGTSALPVFIRLLNQAQMSPKDVRLKFLPAAKIVDALSNGRADAIFETRYYTEVVLGRKAARVLLDQNNIVQKLGLIQAEPLLTRKELIEKEPDTVQKFVTGWVKALQYIQREPVDAARILTIFFHRQGVTTVSMPMAKLWVGFTSYDRYLWSTQAIKDAEYNAWGLKEVGELKEIPKLAGYIDNHFARDALARLDARKPAPSATVRTQTQ